MIKEAQEELAYKAVDWCNAHGFAATPQHIVCALDNLGFLNLDEIQWAKQLINKAVEIMTVEQLSQWEGVRAWQEMIDDSD